MVLHNFPVNIEKIIWNLVDASALIYLTLIL